MRRPDFEIENKLGRHFRRIIGVDEAGRGPLAGPVVASAVFLPQDHSWTGLNDSKQLSVERREYFYERIMAVADVGIGMASVNEIDEINILNATFLAMRRAIAQLKQKPDFVLVDGNRKIKQLDIPQQTVVKGDSKSLSIAAASVIAKVTRDRIMTELSVHFPDYGFARHKGYGTLAHRRVLGRLGVTEHHRKSFKFKVISL